MGVIFLQNTKSAFMKNTPATVDSWFLMDIRMPKYFGRCLAVWVKRGQWRLDQSSFFS